MRPRFLTDAAFEPDAAFRPGATIELPERAAHHALRVLRLRDGDPIELFDGAGAGCVARLVAQGRHARAAVEGRLPDEPPPPLRIILAQCVSSSDKMDWSIEKSVELGVAAIVPVLSGRGIARLDAQRAQRKHEHWREVTVAACMQCGRQRLPELSGVVSLAALLHAPPPAERRLLLSPRGAGSLRALGGPPRSVLLLAGPEAGLTDDEERAALAAGFAPVRLGPRVLRTETAGPAAIAALNALYGDF